MNAYTKISFQDAADYIMAETMISGRVRFTSISKEGTPVTFTGGQVIDFLASATHHGVDIAETATVDGRVAFEVRTGGSVYGRYTQA